MSSHATSICNIDFSKTDSWLISKTDFQLMPVVFSIKGKWFLRNNQSLGLTLKVSAIEVEPHVIAGFPL